MKLVKYFLTALAGYTLIKFIKYLISRLKEGEDFDIFDYENDNPLFV